MKFNQRLISIDNNFRPKIVNQINNKSNQIFIQISNHLKMLIKINSRLILISNNFRQKIVNQ